MTSPVFDVERYDRLVGLCRQVAEAAGDPDVTPTVAGHFLGELSRELAGSSGITELHEQWCVFYGGPDPENCADWEERYGPVDARERLQWMVNAGIAHRTMYAGAWMIDQAPRGEDGDER